MFGTDFTLIAKLFPRRTRKHIKKKYLREDAINSERIESAMSGQVGGGRVERGVCGAGAGPL